MLTTEEKNCAISSGSFVVSITQNLEGGTGDSSAPLQHLTAAVSSFSFTENLSYSEDDDYFLADDDEDDEDAESQDPGDYQEGEPTVDFTLTLDYQLTFSVIRELRECLPLPDDTDIVVRIEYRTPSGEPIFYHEFRGYPVVPPGLTGTIGSKEPLTGKLDLDCENFSLFNLVTK